MNFLPKKKRYIEYLFSRARLGRINLWLFFSHFYVFLLFFRNPVRPSSPFNVFFTIGKPILSPIPFPFTGEVFHRTNLSLFYDFEEVAVDLMEIDFRII